MVSLGKPLVKQPLSAETLAAQALGEIDPEYGDLVPPIHPSTTYEFGPDGTYRSGRAYTRSDNPTYDHAERLLATLEGGAGCVLFASGNAAATAVFQSLLPGDHVLVARVLYWGVRSPDEVRDAVRVKGAIGPSECVGRASGATPRAFAFI